MGWNFTEVELKIALQLRAIEWTNWPAFLSPLFVPILLIWVDWWLVLLGLVLVEMLWCLVRYRVHNFAIANIASAFVQFGKWPVAILGFVVLIYHKHYAISFLSLLWPVLHGFIAIPGQVGLAELNFAREIGYIRNSEEEDFEEWTRRTTREFVQQGGNEGVVFLRPRGQNPIVEAINAVEERKKENN